MAFPMWTVGWSVIVAYSDHTHLLFISPFVDVVYNLSHIKISELEDDISNYKKFYYINVVIYFGFSNKLSHCDGYFNYLQCMFDRKIRNMSFNCILLTRGLIHYVAVLYLGFYGRKRRYSTSRNGLCNLRYTEDHGRSVAGCLTFEGMNVRLSREALHCVIEQDILYSAGSIQEDTFPA